MNVKTIAAAFALTVAAAPGFAGGAAMNEPMKMSRVEVSAGIANPGGSYLSRGEAYGTVVPVSTRSRSDVLAELRDARASGLIVAGSESYGGFRSSDFVSTRSRAEVMTQASSLGRHDDFYRGS